MTTYHIRPGSFRELRGKLLLQMSLLSLMTLFAGHYMADAKGGTDGASASFNWLFNGGVLLFMAYLTFRNMKRQRVMFESITLMLDEDRITRTQLNVPTKSLAASDITSIERNAKGLFTIRGQRAADTIWMPAQVEHPEELAQALARFGPVQLTKAPAWYISYLTLAAGLAMTALLYFFYTSSDKLVVLLTGVPVIGIMIYAFWALGRSKDLDVRIKRLRWFFLLPTLSFLVILIVKLTQ